MQDGSSQTRDPKDTTSELIKEYHKLKKENFFLSESKEKLQKLCTEMQISLRNHNQNENKIESEL